MIGTDIKERKKRRYEANREAILVRRRKSYEDDPEKFLERGRKYYAKNKEKVRLLQKQWKEKNPTYQRNYDLKKYGISIEGWDALFERQERKCAICASDHPNSKKGWHLDHCHATNAIRGILCGRCNVALGRMRDSVDILRAAIHYLTKSKENMS